MANYMPKILGFWLWFLLIIDTLGIRPWPLWDLCLFCLAIALLSFEWGLSLSCLRAWIVAGNPIILWRIRLNFLSFKENTVFDMFHAQHLASFFRVVCYIRTAWPIYFENRFRENKTDYWWLRRCYESLKAAMNVFGLDDQDSKYFSFSETK